MTLIINEIHFDPASGVAGDANGDGTRDFSQDEFIEIVNTSGSAIDISGWTLSDDDGDDFTFPANTILSAGQALVLFGGGTPPGNVGDGQPNSNFGGALVFVDDGSIGSGLSNSGEVIELRDENGSIVDSVGYGNSGSVTGGSDQSITRDPDGSGNFTDHSVATGANSALYSPGTQVDGSPFDPPVTILFEESFETDGNGARYTTSITEDTDGFADYFTRSDGSNIGSFVSYLDPDGDFFFAAMDTDGSPLSATSATLNFSGIDISGATNLNFAIDVAEDDSSDGNEDWDADTSLIIEYSIDGGAFQNLLAFEAEGDTNTQPAQDTNFDGLGDGTALSDTFSTFTAAIAGSGSSIDIRITFNNLTAGDEDIAIDNIRLVDGEIPVATSPGVLSIADASVTEGDSGVTELVVTVTRSGGTAGQVTADLAVVLSAEGVPGFASESDIDEPGFLALDNTFVFEDGQTTATIALPLSGDTEVEPDETFGISIFNPTGGATIDPEGVSARATILNDDFPPQGPAEVFINEIHYDDANADDGEAIEIAGPAGTDLSGWTLELYNGNGGGVYNTIALSGIIPDQDDGFGTLSFLQSGIQNGSPDGIALVSPLGQAVQFLSYEGTLTATSGAAQGQTSEDIGVSENNGTPEGTSLQLVGNGFVYDDFTWASSQAETFDAVNTGQDFAAANPAGTLFIQDSSAAEGDSGTTAMTFNVFRVGGSTGAISVDYAVQIGSTIGFADSSDLDEFQIGTVNFADGEKFQTITIDINGDTVGEANEIFAVALTTPTGGATIGQRIGTGTILNDDDLNLEIWEIQGAGHTSPFDGNEVNTSGIVTAIATNGFYMQTADADTDGDAATSDGIFVFTGAAPTVAVGDGIDVTGTVGEFLAGGDPANLTITQLTNPNITVQSTGNALPTATVIGPNGVSPPTETVDDDNFATFDPTNDGIDFYESLEGMLVTIKNPVAVDQTNGFGELWTVASDGEGGLVGSNISDEGLLVIDGGESGELGSFNSGAGSDFNPERIQIDSAGEINGQLIEVPYVLPGTVLNDVTGIVTYAFENYQVLPTAQITVAQASTNIAEATTLVQGASNQLSVATYNVLNADINPNDGDDDVASGQALAIITDIAFNLDTPDIVVLQEVQDDSGAANDGTVSAEQTLQALADAVFSATGVRYEILDNPFVVDGATGGQPGGNIRVAMLYNPDRVTLDEASVFTITEPGDTALNAAFANSRAPLGANFTFNGETVTVIGNHFTSKIGSDNTFSANQPPTNAGATARAAQAAAVNAAVDDLVQADPDANVIVVGDFNEFQFEEPMRVLTGELDFDGVAVSAGAGPVLENLTNDLAPEDRFSVLFQGNAQMLDHILATSNLASASQIDAVHTNTPLGNPGSDHDPLLAVFEIGLNTITGTRFADTLVGTEDPDIINGGNDDDIIDGNGGDDQLNGESGADTVNGGEGSDTISGGDGGDTLNGDAGDDDIDGGRGNDDINGGTGDDTINGGIGLDNLFGGQGKDFLTGGSERDNFVLDAAGRGADADIVTDFTVQDTIEIINSQGRDVTFTQRGLSVDIRSDGVFVAVVLNAAVADVEARTTFSIPIPDGANVIEGTGSGETIDGTEGVDFINGGNGDDTINGLGGNDVLNPGFGADTVNGGEGDDEINGDLGGETLNGDGGNDTISGGDGNDELNGGADSDTLMGDDGLDILFGGNGRDFLTGGADRDTFVLDANANGRDSDIVLDFEGIDTLSLIGAAGKAITITQRNNDVDIRSDGLLVAVILQSSATEVEQNVEFDAPPASVNGVASMTVAEAALMQVPAEDELFTFVETPLGDLAPLAPQTTALMQNGSSLGGMLKVSAASGFDYDDEWLGLSQDPWAPYMGLSHDHLV
jgi:predicted extracellular nuclease